MKVLREKFIAGMNVLNSQEIAAIKKTKIVYAICRNMQRIESEIKAIKKVCEMKVDGFAEYEAERKAVCRKHAEMTANGESATVNGVYLFHDRAAAYDDINALKEKHAAVLEAQEALVSGEHKAFLEEEVDFEPFIIKREDLPEEFVSNQVMKVLMDLGIVAD